MEALKLDPLTEFFSAIRNPQTRRGYEADLKKFFDYLKIEGAFKAQAKFFCLQAQSDPKWATIQINGYIQSQKERVEKGEIAGLASQTCTSRSGYFVRKTTSI